MPCVEINTQKYQTRKSPPFSANQCKNTIKKGKDGIYISKSDKNGVYKWVKYLGKNVSPTTTNTRKVKKGVKSYRINDNGNKPFKVTISNNTVEIYKGDRIDNGTDDYDEHRNYDQLVKKLTVKKVYPGESPCKLAIVSGFDCGKYTIGNTVLLQLDETKCIFVGKEIYEFKLEDEIEAYYSAIGLNSVSYPVLLGTKYVYLLSDHIYIPRDIFKAPMNPTEWADAYSYYYGFKDISTGKKTIENTKKIGKTFITTMKIKYVKK